jgi:hypothetical protein
MWEMRKIYTILVGKWSRLRFINNKPIIVKLIITNSMEPSCSSEAAGRSATQ